VRVLVVDVGNTRVKSAVVEDGRVVDYPPYDRLGDVDADGILVLSVVPSRTSKVLSLFNRDTVVVEKVKDSSLDELFPEQLGVDRVCAMLGAISRYPAPLVVVDAGTAVTVDFVGRDGKYVGGFIMPGVELCLKALANGAELLPYVSPEKIDGEVWEVEYTTEGSMLRGCVLGIAGGVDSIIRRMELHTGMQFFRVGGGGEFDLLTGWLSVDEIDNDIIFLGGWRLYVEGR